MENNNKSISTMESGPSHSYKNLQQKSKENTDDNEGDIVYRLLNSCKKEMENNCLHKPLEDYLERVAFYTGLSKIRIKQIACIREIDKNKKYFKLNQRLEIIKNMADMYTMNINPTHKNVYTMCRSINIDMNFYQFQYMMNILGYEYRRNELGKELIVEDPELTFELYLYLKQILKLRHNRAPIYFIDEVFIDKTYTFPKPWVKNIDISSESCDGYVFFHAVSIKGCLNGFFCSPTTKKDFLKWITHILLPNLQEPSVIVMDTNYLHRSRVNVITKYHSKEEMLKYLRLKNIPCSENFDKADLYSLITKCTRKHVTYDIDDILKSHGHYVLWLPSKYYDLSMTHFLWKYILESNAMELRNKDLREVKIKLFEGLMQLEPKIWSKFDEELTKLENQIFDIHHKTSTALENNYKFNDKTLDNLE